MRDPKFYLKDILKSIDSIEEFISGIDYCRSNKKFARFYKTKI